jgi:hypothetical protein
MNEVCYSSSRIGLQQAIGSMNCYRVLGDRVFRRGLLIDRTVGTVRSNNILKRAGRINKEWPARLARNRQESEHMMHGDAKASLPLFDRLSNVTVNLRSTRVVIVQ